MPGPGNGGPQEWGAGTLNRLLCPRWARPCLYSTLNDWQTSSVRFQRYTVQVCRLDTEHWANSSKRLASRPRKNEIHLTFLGQIGEVSHMHNKHTWSQHRTLPIEQVKWTNYELLLPNTTLERPVSEKWSEPLKNTTPWRPNDQTGTQDEARIIGRRLVCRSFHITSRPFWESLTACAWSVP